jgi:UDP-N-acetylmuramyl pentapeptide phosphotransferase/UDP-N-acetylglucosamine-1-phosphate transferase
MEVSLLGLLVDAGLCVLAWMVQLIVYPGFLEYSPPDLRRWHYKYTPRITGIVAPLMLTQLALSVYHVIREPNVLSILVLILILSIWVITFLLFVPIHQRIDKSEADKTLLIKLVRLSWLRTVPWTLVLLIDLINYLKIM